jgi:hypothetical protein
MAWHSDDCCDAAPNTIAHLCRAGCLLGLLLLRLQLLLQLTDLLLQAGQLLAVLLLGLLHLLLQVQQPLQGTGAQVLSMLSMQFVTTAQCAVRNQMQVGEWQAGSSSSLVINHHPQRHQPAAAAATCWFLSDS